MTPVQFHVREAAGLPSVPTSTSGAPRGRLRPGLPWHTVHYTGVIPAQVFSSGGDGVFDTIEQAFAGLRRIEEVARASGKPFEYNTMIPVMADGSAHVIAYADEYQAAHSAGENADAHGTQFMTGIGQDLNAGAIRAMRWWHAVLLATGRLAAGVGLTPHHDMPGAATACPGPAIEAHWPELIRPWSAADEEQPQPAPSTPEDAPMFRYKDDRYANEWLMPAGITYGGPAVSDALDGLPLVTGTHDQMLAGLCLRAWPMDNLGGDPRPTGVIAAYEALGFLVR